MNRRFMRTTLTVLSLLCLAAAGQAEWIGFDGAVKSAPSVTVSEVGSGRTLVEIVVPGLEVETVVVNGTEHVQISMPGGVQLLDRGEPELPYLTTALIVPDLGTPKVRILKTDYVDIATLPVVPARGAILRSVDPSTVPYEYGPAYAGGVFPSEIAAAGEPYIMRDYRGVAVRLFPVQWDVDRGVLRLLRRVTYEVVTEGDGGVNALTDPPRAIHRPFPAMYRNHFANYDGAAKYTLNSAEGPLLIVSYDAFESAMQPFIAWKMQRGLDVELITTSSVGGTVAGIQNAIQTRYNSPEGLAYVILVGDGPQVPHYSGAYESADDDTRYVRLAGSDVYPDALISRISAINATQVATQINKFIQHERDIVAPADWTHMGTGIASNEGSPSDIERMEWLRADLLAYNYTHMDQIYQGQGGSTTMIANAINAGRSLVNYIGHGSGTSWSNVPFNNSNVHALTNTAWPWIIDVACLNGGISAIGESFAEAWMRTGTPEQPRGAVGMYASSTSTPWVPPCVMQEEAVDLLCAEASQVIGVLVHGGIMKVLDTYGQTGTGLQLVEQYNLFGDCSLVVRTLTPAVLAMDHLPVVPLFAPTFSVDAGAPGVTVTLSGDGVIYGTGTTDASGHVDLVMVRDIADVGELTLTAFGYNAATYQATILAVVPANVVIDPASVPVGVPTDVTVTVTDPDTGDGLDDVLVEILGFGFASAPVQTDGLGQVVITVLPEFGEVLLVRGKEIGATYDLFSEGLPVTGALPLDEPSVTAGVPGIGMDGTLTPHLEGEVHASVADAGFTLLLRGGGLDLTEQVAGVSATLAVTPTELSTVMATITRPGYEIFQQPIAVVAAFGTLAGTVGDADAGGAPLAGVRLLGFAAGADPSGTPLFDLETNASGAFAYGEDLPVGYYDLYASKFGYLAHEETYFLLFGPNDHEIAMHQAPSGVIAGVVTSTEDSSPLEAVVRIYRTDNGALYHQTQTDPATGAYETAALPFFTYNVDVRSFRFIPQSRAVVVEAAAVTEDFQLEPTQGDLLLLDDNSVMARFVEPKLGKNGVELAAGYLEDAGRAAADIATDLEELGYTVTVQAAAATDPATWGLYDLVIYCSGGSTTPLSSTSLRAALTAHRAAGGKLLVEGGEVAYRMNYNDSAFLNNVLYVSAWNGDSAGNVTVADASHHVMSVPNQIAGPITLNYSGYGSSDYVTAAAGAQVAGSWSSQPTRASVICYDSNPDPQGGQFVFFAFNYSQLGAGRTELLHNTVHWLITPEQGDATVSGVAFLYGEQSHAGVTVSAVPGGGSVVTQGDGSFTLTGLYAGTYNIVASLDGWATASFEVTLTEGETVSGLNLLLTPVEVTEVCIDPAAPILDNQTTTSAMVWEIDADVTDVAVYVNISHTYIGDLRVVLRAPSGREVVLHNRTGSSADDIIGWYPGQLAPSGNLQDMIGEPIAGTWSLVVSDHASYDQGTLNGWCLRLTHGIDVITAVEREIPVVLALEGNYPNPFNPMTVIRFAVPAPQQIDLAVYDVRGQKVRTLVRDVMPAGHHSVAWQGHDDAGRQVASGVYFYRLTAGGESLVRKMLLLK